MRIEEDRLQKEIDAIRAKYKDDEEFQKYEAMLDAGIDLARLKYREIRRLRKDLQIVFQDPFSSLDPRMTVGQILEEALVSLRPELTPAERLLRMQALLKETGLDSESLERLPHEFSGGQRQRIAIARALSVEPEVIVLDEPTSALDVSVQAQILNLLGSLQRERGLAYLLITHNFAVVEHAAHRVAVMQGGRIVEEGAAAAVLTHPKAPYTKRLLASVPRLLQPYNSVGRH